MRGRVLSFSLVTRFPPSQVSAFAAASDHDPATALSLGVLSAERPWWAFAASRFESLRTGVILDFPSTRPLRGLARIVVKRVGGCVSGENTSTPRPVAMPVEAPATAHKAWGPHGYCVNGYFYSVPLIATLNHLWI